MPETHHSHLSFLLEVGTEITIPAGIVEHFVDAPEYDHEITHTPIVQPKVMRGCREGNTFSFDPDGQINVFVPGGLAEGDKVSVLWEDPEYACLVTDEQKQQIPTETGT
jgi:hypothetical protein